MVGDTKDVVSRIKQVLPVGWFSDTTPILDGLLTGLGNAWSALYGLIQFVQQQARILTATGIFLDIAALDYTGDGILRRDGEPDSAFRLRVQNWMLSPRATRAGLSQMLKTLTGRPPVIFEPLNAADTGGYNVNLGYNQLGGYGCLSLPFQFFVTAYRPNDTPIYNASGYGEGPGGYNTAPMFYGADAEFAAAVSDDQIYAAIASVLPTTGVAWTKISN
jgi:hypothetical protein